MEHDEEQHDAFPCSHAEGLIWVDDTTASGYPSRLQKEFDRIGEIMPKFTVRPFAPFADRRLDGWGVPCDCRLIEHRWDDPLDDVHARQSDYLRQWAFDLSDMHKRAPYNSRCLADLFLRYTQQDGRIVPNWKSSHQYFSVMTLDDLEACGMLAKPRGRREKKVVALVEERSGLVLPLPSGCVVSWMHFGGGSGVEISVYDGAALSRRMTRYPQYFDRVATLNDDDIERDIIGCLNVLDRLESGLLTQAELLRNMPAYPFDRYRDSHANLKERN